MLLILIGACWLFALGTFANIFLTDQTHLLDKRGKEFFKHFPGLLIATGSILALTPYLASAVVAKGVLGALSYWGVM
jgi:hypothetical protein